MVWCGAILEAIRWRVGDVLLPMGLIDGGPDDSGGILVVGSFAPSTCDSNLPESGSRRRVDRGSWRPDLACGVVPGVDEQACSGVGSASSCDDARRRSDGGMPASCGGILIDRD